MSFDKGEINDVHNSPWKKDKYRQQELICKEMIMLSEVLKKSDLASQNKLLSMIIYKHKNQLRMCKSMQYGRRISKLVGRFDSDDVCLCLNELQLHLNQSCSCIWKKVGDPSCNEKKKKLINSLLCRARIISEVLKSCKSVLPLIMSDLKLKHFLSYNAFMLSHICRVRVIALRLYEMFTEVFQKLEILNMVVKDEMNHILSLHSVHLFENEIASKLAQNQEINAKDEENNIPGHDGSIDIGFNVARKDFKPDKPKAKASTHGKRKGGPHSKKKNPTSVSGSLTMKQKKAKRKVKHVTCHCWKCKQMRKYFAYLKKANFAKNMFHLKGELTNFWMQKSKTGAKGKKDKLLSKKKGAKRKVNSKKKKTKHDLLNESTSAGISQEMKIDTALAGFFSRPCTKPDDIDMIFGYL